MKVCKRTRLSVGHPAVLVRTSIAYEASHLKRSVVTVREEREVASRAPAIEHSRLNAAICDFHNDAPTPCEEANRRIFIDPGFNVRYSLPFG